MKRKASGLLALLLALTMGLTACGGGGDASNGGGTGGGGASANEASVLRYAHVFDDMDGLDVHRFTTTDVIQASMPLVEPLVRLDEDGEAHPLLLASLPQANEEGTLFTFELKQGVLFHDGTELTSEDVLFTFERIFDPVEPSVNYWLVDMILGAVDYMEGNADTIEGITIIDEYNFTMELEYPFAPFISSLACEQNAIYPKAACEAAGEMWGITSFVGTGPFELVDFMSKDYMHAQRYENYHGTPAALDELWIYNMDQQTGLFEWEAGNIDIVWMESAPAAQYIGSEFEDQLVRVDQMGIKTLNLNVDIGVLNEAAVREAIKYAVNQEALVNSFLQGLANPTFSLIPPGVMAHSDRGGVYDPEHARQILADAGYPDGIDLVTYVVESDEAVGVVTVLQQQFLESGINLEINLVDQATYVEMRRAGEVQCPILTWYKDISDPDNFIYTFYHSMNSRAFSSNWNDAYTDELLTRGRQETDPAAREAIYVELEEYLLFEQSICVPLYNPSHFYLIQDRVSGVVFDNSLLRFDAASVA